jgi:hypothetical protein
MSRFFLALSLIAVARLAPAQVPDCSLVAGWQQQGPARTYAADNLFEYMDGNAEGYLIYRFVNMSGVTCKRGEDTILIDISEMVDAEFAFGLFSANRDPRQPVQSIGMAGQILPRRAIFAKDKYFVELAANPAKDHSAALQEFVAQLEKKISGRSTPPDQLSWFPREGLNRESLRLVPESVLGIRLMKRGYVGQYEFGKGFLVAEETPDAAAQLMTKLRARFGQTEPISVADEAFTASDKYLDGLCVFRKGQYVGGFANLKNGRDARPEAERLAGNIK